MSNEPPSDSPWPAPDRATRVPRRLSPPVLARARESERMRAELEEAISWLREVGPPTDSEAS